MDTIIHSLAQIPSSVLTSFFGILTASISAFISYRVAKHTSVSEIKKLHLTWEHEKNVSYDKDFSDMVTSVTRYLKSSYSETFNNAIDKINLIRVKSSGDLSIILDDLYSSLATFQTGYNPDRDAIFSLLTAAVEQKRVNDAGKNTGHVNRAKKHCSSES